MTISTMNKQDEISVLRRCAAELGAGSYCGPWLAEVIGEVESAVRSDFFPEVTLRESAARAADIVAAAELRGREILAAAERRGVEIEAEARKRADRVDGFRWRAAEALRRSIESLEAV